MKLIWLPARLVLSRSHMGLSGPGKGKAEACIHCKAVRTAGSWSAGQGSIGQTHKVVQPHVKPAPSAAAAAAAAATSTAATYPCRLPASPDGQPSGAFTVALQSEPGGGGHHCAFELSC